MAMFIHLAPESRVAMIRRNGIGRLRKQIGQRPGGLYAVPVTKNFYLSHQWLRELRRGGAGPLAAVVFRIPDDDRVWVGHYRGGHRKMTAAQAVATFLADEKREGWEVIVPRRVEANEIHRIRRVRQVFGWRFSPDAKGKPPYCTCKFCTRGVFGSRRLRETFGSAG